MKTALVLSGGGAKGAFQVMAEKYAREKKGYTWDIIAGVSVGALNAVMLAMEKYDQLENIWKTISNNKVYTGKLSWWTAIRLLFGAKSIYGNKPLEQMINTHYEPAALTGELSVGTVSLHTGEYRKFNQGDKFLNKAVLASTAIPIMFPPQEVDDDQKNMVDGGVRNISPLGDVLDKNPDKVIIINCSPRAPSAHPAPFKNLLDIGMRSMEIALNEIFITDIREFLRINRNVKDAEDQGATLKKADGSPYKSYDFEIIEPDNDLGDTLDFSRSSVDRSMEAGWKTAERILGP